MFTSGLTQALVLSNVQNKLTRLREVLGEVADLEAWATGVASSDLTALGFSPADADTLKSAIADANAIAQIYATGLPPGTYPQPGSAYPYSASQRQVIGPQ